MNNQQLHESGLNSIRAVDARIDIIMESKQ